MKDSVLFKLAPITVAVWAACFSSSLLAQGQERPLTLTARQTLSLDSNVLQLPVGASPPASYGTGKRGDLISNTSVSGGYVNSFGTQNVSATADLGLVRYANLGRLNRNTYSLGGSLNGDLTPMLYSSFNLSTSRIGTSFANQFSLEPNLTTTLQVGGQLGFRFNPTWSVFGGLDQIKRDNSAVQLASADSRLSGKEVGIRYQPQSGLDGSAVWRQVDAKFPNAQTRDFFGNLLPSAVNNGYQQNQALLRLSYQPNGISSFNGEVGVSSLDYATLSQRNSNGVLLKVNYNYLVSDAWSLTARVGRDSTVVASAFASSVQDTSAGVSASWKPTGRIIVRGNLDLSKRNFNADAGVALGVTANRRDSYLIYGVGGTYELLRNLNLTANLSRYDRSSSISNFSSTGSTVLVGLDLLLR
jgi:Putative beta-barrel porin 2